MDDINELMGMDDHNESQKYSQANDQDITQKSQNWTPPTQIKNRSGDGYLDNGIQGVGSGSGLLRQ